MKRLQVYLEQLGLACLEASQSRDPRVIGLCMALVARAPMNLWELISRMPFASRLRGA